MRRRILLAMLGVTAVALAIFAAPLATALGDLHREEEVVRLGRTAAEASAEVPRSFPSGRTPVEFVGIEGDRHIALYGRDLRRVTGSGPGTADAVVRSALRDDVRDAEVDGQLVLGMPLTRGERVVGALRVSVPMHVVTDRTRTAVLVMGAIALLAVAGSGLVALWQSRRIAEPVRRLAERAGRLGRGDFTVRSERSRIPEVDEVGAALDTTAIRLDRMLTRERTFSEDASHQLRTPLTGLRLTLEEARLDGRRDTEAVVDEALTDVGRIEATIDDLLRLAREPADAAAATDVRAVLADEASRWARRAEDAGRTLEVDVSGELPPSVVSEAALRQILEVLVDNALRHGRGRIGVTARPAGGGTIVEVTDDGPGIGGDTGAIFERRVSPAGGSGIGLALARSLAESDGARLRLARAGPGPVFELALPGPPRDGAALTAG